MENGQEKSPISVSSLAADDTLDRAQNSEVLDFPHRIERYGRARKRAVEMGDYLSNFQLSLPPVTPIDPLLLPDVTLEEQVKKATIRLKDCGNWLHFRNYYTLIASVLLMPVFAECTCFAHFVLSVVVLKI